MPNNWITPFAYIDDAGALHLCCDRALEAVGLPKTEENLRIAEEHLAELLKEPHPDAKVYSNVEREIRENPAKIDRRPEAEIFAEEVAAIKKASVPK